MTDEQTIGEVYEGANDEALEAYEATQEDVVEDPTPDTSEENEVEKDPVEGLPETENEDPEDDNDDDDEEDVIEEDSEQAEDVEAVVEEPVQWDGNPSTIPDQLKPTYDTMVKGMNAKFQEIAAMKQELQSQLDKAKSEPEPVAEDDRPPMPTEDDDTKAYNEKWAAINAWNAKQAVKEMQENAAPNQELAEVKQALEAQRRYTKLTQTDGYSPEVEAVMVQIAQSNTYWADQLQASDDGTFALFQMAKQHLDSQTVKASSAKQAEEKVKQKVAAGKRKSPRPGGTRKASPAENFAEMGFDDLNRLAQEQYEALQKK